jgi:predicted RNA methylase
MITIKDGGEKGSGASRFFKEGANNDIFTPPALAKRMWEIAIEQYKSIVLNKTWRPLDKNLEKNLCILDPCCGKGALIEAIPQKLYSNVTAIDNNIEYLKEVEQKYPDISWIHTDFMKYKGPEDYKFDIILMNPPFSIIRGQPNIPFWDHALELLDDNGVIVSVCPNYYLVNNEKRNKIYANNILHSWILPKRLFATKADGKPKPFHTNLVVLVKHCENNTFLFL